MGDSKSIDQSSIREARVGIDDDAVCSLMSEYLTWAHERLASDYGVIEIVAGPSEVRSSIDGLRRPNGVLLLARQGDEPAGIAALRWLSPAVVELKRMYVPDRFRGRHVGSVMLDQLIDEARHSAATLVRLDSVRFMIDAQQLYRSRGFVEREPYEGSEIPPHL